ncbi:MAG: rod shape-determining protein MreC [Bacteroidales bacterium]
MNDLFQILRRLQNLVIFLLLEGVCIFIILKNNDFQIAQYAGSHAYMTGKLYELRTSIGDYFKLRKNNERLINENSVLKLQLLASRYKEIPDYHHLSDSLVLEKAKIINLSRTRSHNHFTISVGRKNGVGVNQGVVSSAGIVGIITNTSENYSLGITLMNEKISVPSKLAKTNDYGIIRWDATRELAFLDEIPQHVELSVGDSVVTSGFSSCFPHGMLIGKVKNLKKPFSSNYYEIEVELAENFSNVENVYVTKLPGGQEITDLELNLKDGNEHN